MYKHFLQTNSKKLLRFCLVFALLLGISPTLHNPASFLGLGSATAKAQESPAATQEQTELPESTATETMYSYKVYLPSISVASANIVDDQPAAINAAGWSYAGDALPTAPTAPKKKKKSRR